MKKTSIASFIICAFLITFVSIAFAQTTEKGWEKTFTLSDGRVILDMSGVWDVNVEHYGPLASRGEFNGIHEIKQEGAFFTAITLIGNENSAKGTEKLKGELDENGFKKVQVITDMGPMDLDSKILLNGNKIVFDEGQMLRLTYIRK